MPGMQRVCLRSRQVSESVWWAGAGVKLLLKTSWATATQLFRMATAPLRWMFWRYAARHNSSSGSASTGLALTRLINHTPVHQQMLS